MKDKNRVRDRFINEIDDLRQQVANLRQYQRIVETTKSPVGMVDQNYVYKYVNRPYCAAFKKKQNEIIDHSVANLSGQEMFDNILQPQYHRCFAGAEVAFQNWFDHPGFMAAPCC